jgi:hypothetical protein
MRNIALGFLLPLLVAFTPSRSFGAESQPHFSQNSPKQSGKVDTFYTKASFFVQEQINLIARMERAFVEPDPNRLRAVRGQLTVHTKSIEGFLKFQEIPAKNLCRTFANASGNLTLLKKQLTEAQAADTQANIWCPLYFSSQELLKLTPAIDRLLSRRGELALVRELPIVSGERQSHPVLSIGGVQRPELSKKAAPFASTEPNLSLSLLPIVRPDAKTAIADYLPPIQPAIAPDTDALATLAVAKQILETAKTAFPKGTKFIEPQETIAALDRFAYDIDAKEPQTYAKFLAMPNTGIFRVLPHSAYHRQLNTQKNRLQPNVSQRYPFPTLAQTKDGFTPSLTLVIDADKFQIVQQGINYGFMANLGDMPIEKLEPTLAKVSLQTREFFLNYQPPKQLNRLQTERKRFFTGKNQAYAGIPAMSSAPIALNQTYLLRKFQFQLPSAVLSQNPISPQERRDIDELLKMQSSDTVVAFRPVRRRNDGSYTIIWRIINQLDAPQIEDLHEHLRTRDGERIGNGL